jgi:hypothetical protein
MYQYIQNFSIKFTSCCEAFDIYKLILLLSIMNRTTTIAAALIAAVSLSAMVYAVPALVAGTNFKLLQEAYAQVNINIVQSSGGG